MGELRRTLAIALVGHALVLAPFVRSVAQQAVVLDAVELDVLSTNDALPEVDPEVGEARLGRTSARAALSGATTREGAARAATPGPSLPEGVEPPEAAHWFSPVRSAPVALSLGLGTSLAPDRPTGPLPRAPTRGDENGAVRAVKEALSEREREAGIVRGGALLTAARAAASDEDAPIVGTMTFEIDADANGVVTSARSEDGGWRGVADAIVRAMRGKTVRVAPGSGLRTRVRVVASLQHPSGEKKTILPGAVPDDIPGGMQPKKCVGEGIHRKCWEGMIVGFTATAADANNLAAAVRRVVHVTILGETELR